MMKLKCEGKALSGSAWLDDFFLAIHFIDKCTFVKP